MPTELFRVEYPYIYIYIFVYKEDVYPLLHFRFWHIQKRYYSVNRLIQSKDRYTSKSKLKRPLRTKKILKPTYFSQCNISTLHFFKILEPSVRSRLLMITSSLWSNTNYVSKCTKGTENSQRCYLLHHQITKDSLLHSGLKMEKIVQWIMIVLPAFAQLTEIFLIFFSLLLHSCGAALFKKKSKSLWIFSSFPKSHFFRI